MGDTHCRNPDLPTAAGSSQVTSTSLLTVPASEGQFTRETHVGFAYVPETVTYLNITASSLKIKLHKSEFSQSPPGLPSTASPYMRNALSYPSDTSEATVGAEGLKVSPLPVVALPISLPAALPLRLECPSRLLRVCLAAGSFALQKP